MRIYTYKRIHLCIYRLICAPGPSNIFLFRSQNTLTQHNTKLRQKLPCKVQACILSGGILTLRVQVLKYEVYTPNHNSDS